MTLSAQAAAFVLKHQGIIAHQTDTVLGLACLPTDKLLRRLCRIKQRDLKKSFILLASSISQLSPYVQLEQKHLDTLSMATNQPTTWLVPANHDAPQLLIGNTNKIAIRISHHTGVKPICDEVGAIASTSANIAGQKICDNLLHVRQLFGPDIDYIDPHQAPGAGKSSSIIDLDTGNVIRR